MRAGEFMAGNHDFNHRSTDMKSAGARINHMPRPGAKSRIHRRKVGGDNSIAESRCALEGLADGLF